MARHVRSLADNQSFLLSDAEVFRLFESAYIQSSSSFYQDQPTFTEIRKKSRKRLIILKGYKPKLLVLFRLKSLLINTLETQNSSKNASCSVMAFVKGKLAA